MITVRWLNADPCFDIKEANCATKRLHPKVTRITPAEWHKLLKAEHSTLRFLSLVVHDEDCPYTVATQIIRSTKEHTPGVMSSGRPDWTGQPRDYSKPRWLHMKFTPIGLIRMMEDRLCSRAELPTRQWAVRLLAEMKQSDDYMIQELATFCSQPCDKYRYCKNGKNCFGFI